VHIQTIENLRKILLSYSFNSKVKKCLGRHNTNKNKGIDLESD